MMRRYAAEHLLALRSQALSIASRNPWRDLQPRRGFVGVGQARQTSPHSGTSNLICYQIRNSMQDKTSLDLLFS